MEQSRYRTQWLIIYWLMFNVVDAMLTFTGLRLGLSEANPFIMLWPLAWLIPIKFGLAMVALWVLQKVGKLHLLLPLNIAMALVVLWNLTLVAFSA